MIAACPLCCHIQLTKGKVALVDPATWVRINRKGWRAKLSKGGWYAYRIHRVRGKNVYTYMHRLIMNCPKGKETHHRNRITLDNCDTNLQNVTPDDHQQTAQIQRLAQYRTPKKFLTTENLPMI